MTEQNVAIAEELRTRIRAAEYEDRAARERYEAFEVSDPTTESTPEYEQAYRDSEEAWVIAEIARHDLDAFLYPKRYHEKGYPAGAPPVSARERVATWARRLMDRSREQPVPSPDPEFRDSVAGPPDAIPPDRPRIDPEAYATRHREATRAESDLRPMPEIHEEALIDAERRDADEFVTQWIVRFYGAALDAGLSVMDPVTGYFYGRSNPSEAHAEINDTLQAARYERDAGRDLEAGR